jgi:hypothetical protein
MENSPAYWAITTAVILALSWLTMHGARHWKGKGTYLCDDCRFNNPQDCLKVERPQAVICTAYRLVDQPDHLSNSPAVTEQ